MLFNVTIMSENNDELIKAQNELIGILFEIIKRLQSNNDLDEEYFQIISKKVRTEIENSRLNEITKERENNAEIVSRLLKQIESN
jgi:hypothetical protein|tara:strand:- start:346 stop:600 length:255 start_codon:yes stop_codon:yes gene_type:complete